MIDGYDEAPLCSSFASGSFDIDIIFHVHCTKPVWCVTPRPPLSDDEQMHNIYDGSEWTRLEIGLKRIYFPNGTIQDVEESPGSRCSLFSSDIGLGLTINIDW